MEFDDIYNCHCVLRLSSGRENVLDELVQSRTYAGLMMGTPNKSSNDLAIKWHLEQEQRDGDEMGQPFLISPVRRDYFRVPGDMQTTIDRQSNTPDDLKHVPEWMPEVVCVGRFRSLQPARDNAKHASSLTIIWCQDDFGLDLHAVDRLREVAWDSHATDCEYKEAEKKNAPELPIGRLLKSTSLGGNRVVFSCGNNMRLLLSMVVFLTICGCSRHSATTPHRTAMSLDVAAARLAELARRPLRPFATRDFGRDRNLEARSVVVSNEEAQPLVAELRAELGPGLVAFVGCTRSLADPADEGSEVVVAHGDSQFDILRVAQSDAVNYNMETEVLVRKLEEYHSKYGIDIFHAETDTIEFRFTAMPSDLAEFCDDLYEFCPDIVDQGVGTVEELQKEIAKTGTVFLWWD